MPIPLGPETALVDALIVALKADADVAALVGARVFDDVPLRSPPPYLYVGPVAAVRLEGGCSNLIAVTVRIFAVSVDSGRAEAWAVLDAARAALNGQILTGPRFPSDLRMVEEVRVIRTGDILSPITPKAVFLDVTATLSF